MDMTTITQYFVPQIVAFCLCVGYIMKRWLPMDNKWIPQALGLNVRPNIEMTDDEVQDFELAEEEDEAEEGEDDE